MIAQDGWRDGSKPMLACGAAFGMSTCPSFSVSRPRRSTLPAALKLPLDHFLARPATPKLCEDGSADWRPLEMTCNNRMGAFNLRRAEYVHRSMEPAASCVCVDERCPNSVSFEGQFDHDGVRLRTLVDLLTKWLIRHVGGRRNAAEFSVRGSLNVHVVAFDFW